MLTNRVTMIQAKFDTENILRIIDGIRDPIRIEIVFLVGRNKAMNVGEITECFKISRPAISHHLKILKDTGILRSERVGQEIYYRLDRKHLVNSLRNLADAVDNCNCNPEE